MSDKIYGIDLGTTYSCIARVDEHGQPVVVHNAEGEATTPSVVYFESPTNIVVGQAAKEVAAFQGDLCVSTVKRAMGDPNWRQDFHGTTYSPQQVSALILRKLVEDARAITGDAIEDVVITCPAYFGFNEKEATRQAGELAGLNVRYVIPEPTAAALAYGIEQTDDQVILVYDLGGGTFDVTVIRLRGGEIQVLTTGGDHQLGGKDWDDALVQHFAQCFEDQTGVSADEVLGDAQTYQELVSTAERCKKNLSSRESVTERILHNADRVAVEVTRETFDRLTADLLQRTLLLTEQEIARARDKHGVETIDHLLLVGGSTYMPQVRGAVEERFSLPVQQFDPNQAVAKGAALFGYKCQLEDEIRILLPEGEAGEAGDLDAADPEEMKKAAETVATKFGLPAPKVEEMVRRKVINVTSRSFGVVVVDTEREEEVVANLIRVQEPVPTERSQRFGTYEDGQTQVDLRCMESLVDAETLELADGVELGQAVLTFERALPEGAPVEITFRLAADGLLQMRAEDLTTHGEIDVEFRTEAILSREEAEAARNAGMSLKVS